MTGEKKKVCIPNQSFADPKHPVCLFLLHYSRKVWDFQEHVVSATADATRES